MEHCLIENNWRAAQTGYAILLTPRNQNGGAPWSVVEDIEIKDNIIRNVSSCFNISGDDDLKPSKRTNNIRILNNLALTHADMAGDGRFAMIGRGPQNISVEHNTTICHGTSWIYTYTGGAIPIVDKASFQGNITFRRKYGFFSPSGEGKNCLNALYTNWTFLNNVIGGASAGAYPPENFTPSSDVLAMEFSSPGILREGSQFEGLGVDYSKLPQF
jgi:hypothetical protein